MVAYVLAAATVVAVVVAALIAVRRRDSYIYVPIGFPTAQFRYQDMAMKECSFCSSKVNLNRHHVIPQLAAPDKRDDPANLIVLCRSCHQVVGHKNNWKKFNPYVADICEKYGGPPIDSREWRKNAEKEEKGACV